MSWAQVARGDRRAPLSAPAAAASSTVAPAETRSPERTPATPTPGSFAAAAAGGAPAVAGNGNHPPANVTPTPTPPHHAAGAPVAAPPAARVLPSAGTAAWPAVGDGPPARRRLPPAAAAAPRSAPVPFAWGSADAPRPASVAGASAASSTGATGVPSVSAAASASTVTTHMSSSPPSAMNQRPGVPRGQVLLALPPAPEEVLGEGPPISPAQKKLYQEVYSAQVYYIRAFQQNPVGFLNEFRNNPEQQARMLEAGLTFYANVDARAPVLINVYFRQFGNGQCFQSRPHANASAAGASAGRGQTRAWRGQSGQYPAGRGGSSSSSRGGHHHHHHRQHHRGGHSGWRPRGPAGNGPPAMFAMPPRGPPRGRVTSRGAALLPVEPAIPFVDQAKVSGLQRQCLNLVKRIVPSYSVLQRRSRLLHHMEKVSRNEFYNSKITLFGSASNGLCLNNGDVDMCLFVQRQAAGAKGKRMLNETSVMKKMAELLRKNKFENIQDLTNARVPIIKMFDPVSGFNIDISINNKLVSANTDLIAQYLKLDPRVKPLILLVKYWARMRDVNQTYRGTLSSYAYVLLVINFCQTRPLPVLPCIQRMRNGRYVSEEECPTEWVRNDKLDADPGQESPMYNIYFDRYHKDGWVSKNEVSLAGLLVEFFRYYAFEFDFRNSVACVRKGCVIPREEKGWDVASVIREAAQAEIDFRAQQEQELAEMEAFARMGPAEGDAVAASKHPYRKKVMPNAAANFKPLPSPKKGVAGAASKSGSSSPKEEKREAKGGSSSGKVETGVVRNEGLSALPASAGVPAPVKPQEAEGAKPGEAKAVVPEEDMVVNPKVTPAVKSEEAVDANRDDDKPMKPAETAVVEPEVTAEVDRDEPSPVKLGETVVAKPDETSEVKGGEPSPVKSDGTVAVNADDGTSEVNDTVAVKRDEIVAVNPGEVPLPESETSSSPSRTEVDGPIVAKLCGNTTVKPEEETAQVNPAEPKSVKLDETTPAKPVETLAVKPEEVPLPESEASSSPSRSEVFISESNGSPAAKSPSPSSSGTADASSKSKEEASTPVVLRKENPVVPTTPKAEDSSSQDPVVSSEGAMDEAAAVSSSGKVSDSSSPKRDVSSVENCENSLPLTAIKSTLSKGESSKTTKSIVTAATKPEDFSPGEDAAPATEISPVASSSPKPKGRTVPEPIAVEGEVLAKSANEAAIEPSSAQENASPKRTSENASLKRNSGNASPKRNSNCSSPAAVEASSARKDASPKRSSNCPGPKVHASQEGVRVLKPMAPSMPFESKKAQDTNKRIPDSSLDAKVVAPSNSTSEAPSGPAKAETASDLKQATSPSAEGNVISKHKASELAASPSSGPTKASAGLEPKTSPVTEKKLPFSREGEAKGKTIALPPQPTLDANAISTAVSGMSIKEFSGTNGSASTPTKSMTPIKTGGPLKGTHKVVSSRSSNKSSVAGSVASDGASPASLTRSPGVRNSPGPSPGRRGPRPRAPPPPPPPQSKPRMHRPRAVERHLFCIEDPFNTSHDLSRIVDEETMLVIQQELVRAYDVLSSTGDMDELLVPYGPLPPAPIPLAQPAAQTAMASPPAQPPPPPATIAHFPGL